VLRWWRPQPPGSTSMNETIPEGTVPASTNGHTPDGKTDGVGARVGVYVCHCGGNISDVVDVDAVARQAEELDGVVVARHLMFMCSDEGQNAILEDMAKLNLDRVVVAACTPKLHEATFRRAVIRGGLNPYLFQAANIREQASWAHPHSPVEATEKAGRLVRAAVAKARLLEPLEMVSVAAVHRALVIGAGVAGLRAALDLARQDIAVTLVEKSRTLGGRSMELFTLFPTEELARPLIGGLIEQVLAEPRITVMTGTQVVGLTGYVGDFRVSLRSDAPPSLALDGQTVVAGFPSVATPAEHEIEVGAIVVATGFDHYEPPDGEYGYGRSPRIITLPQLHRLLDPEGPTGGRLEIQGEVPRTVAVIHCVGSRQIEGVDTPAPGRKLNEYCSRVCCTAALQAANQIRTRYPSTQVVDLYRDIRTYQKDQERYYVDASKNGVVFLRFADDTRPTVELSDKPGGYPLRVKVRDTLTFGAELEVPVDLVVLNVGVQPRDIADLVEMTKLPVGNDGFLLEVHPKLRPVETAIPGVLLAGTAQAPMDITESTSSASASAAKVTTLLAKDHVEMEPFVARVDPSRCDGCGLCIDACHYPGALALREVELEDERVEMRAYVNPVACTGCGACVPTCPVEALDVQGWELAQYRAMVDAIVAEPIAVAAGAGSNGGQVA
jgi:heterodisulfide reductase subunit A2